MSDNKSSTESKEILPASSTAQQGDNIAHALAGAGGGLLSMTLTLVLDNILAQNVSDSKLQIPSHYTIYSSTSRV